MKKTDHSSGRFLQILLYLVFMIYLLLMCRIILFKYSSFSQVVYGVLHGKVDGFRSCNLIPFLTVRDFAQMAFHGQFWRSFANIMGNLFIFSPLGYFLPLLSLPFQKPRRVFLFSVSLSILFEVLQYALYLGSSDIDDVILNAAGAMVGCGTFYGVRRFTKGRRRSMQKVTLLLSAVCFCLGALIAVPRFGLFLGIRMRSADTKPGYIYDDLSGGLPGDASVKTEITLPDKTGDGTDSPYKDSSGGNAANGSAKNNSGSGEDTLNGYITSFTEDGFFINKITTQELDNGGSIAYSGQGKHQQLIPVRVSPDAVYREKRIYDMYGNRVEWADITKDLLEADDNVELRGHEENGVFTASEVIVNTFTFME